MPDLRDVKVGDAVWIKPQHSRWGGDQPGFIAEVCKVARVYARACIGSGYATTYHEFHRDTGASKEKPDSNARANGFGFDVYHSEDEFKKELQAANEKKALIRRLDRGFAVEIRKLPPEAVREITAILDRHAEREE